MVIHPQLTKWFDEDYKIFKKLFDDIASIVKPYITSHQNSLDSDADPKDFMDVYLNEVSKTSDLKSSFHGQRGEESLISTMTDLFLAGTETTTSSLLWAILCLLHYPEVQAKVQDEIDHVIGSGKKGLSINDVTHLGVGGSAKR